MLESKDVYALSDDELLQMLKKYKGPVGPIMDGTRTLYQRKLCKILNSLNSSMSNKDGQIQEGEATDNTEIAEDSMEIIIKVYPEQKEEDKSLPAESSELVMSISGVDEAYYGKDQTFEDISVIESSDRSNLTLTIEPDSPETQQAPSKLQTRKSSPQKYRKESTPRKQPPLLRQKVDTPDSRVGDHPSKNIQQNLRHRPVQFGAFMHSSPLEDRPNLLSSVKPKNSLPKSPQNSPISIPNFDDDNDSEVQNSDSTSPRRPYDTRINHIMNRTLVSPPWLDSYSRSFSRDSFLEESMSDSPPRTVNPKSPPKTINANSFTFKFHSLLQKPYIKVSFVASTIVLFLFAVLIYFNMEEASQHPFLKEA